MLRHSRLSLDPGDARQAQRKPQLPGFQGTGGEAVLNSWNVAPAVPAAAFPAFLIPLGSPGRGCCGNRGCRSEQCLNKSWESVAARAREHPSRVTRISWAASIPFPALGVLLSPTPFPEAGRHSSCKPCMEQSNEPPVCSESWEAALLIQVLEGDGSFHTHLRPPHKPAASI